MSDNTMVVMLVFLFCACTNTPESAAPAGPLTVPVMVAASLAAPQSDSRINGISLAVGAFMEFSLRALLRNNTKLAPAACERLDNLVKLADRVGGIHLRTDARLALRHDR